MTIMFSTDLTINLLAKQKIEALAKEEQDEIGRKIVDVAKDLVPVDTGALQSSIKSNRVGGDLFVSTSTGYGGYVEFGTVKMSAQPFLMPAVMIVADEIGT